MQTRAKPLELILRWDGHEAKHVFKQHGDFAQMMTELTQHCGIPIDLEIVSVVSQEVTLDLLPIELFDAITRCKACGPALGASPTIRRLMAELIDEVKTQIGNTNSPVAPGPCSSCKHGMEFHREGSGCVVPVPSGQGVSGLGADTCRCARWVGDAKEAER